MVPMPPKLATEATYVVDACRDEYTDPSVLGSSLS